VHAAVSTQRVGYAIVRARDDPSSDMDMSMTALVMANVPSHERSWTL
jgi:hypothetical protein